MRVEPARSSLHRLAPVALAALGIFGALLTIFAGLVALNHSVLPFNGWPSDGERLDAGRQVLPRAPVETGRLRTAPGGALAGASIPSVLARVAVPVAVVEPRTTALVGQRLQRGTTHAASPKVVRTPAQQQPAATPQPSPAPAPAVGTSAPTAIPAAVTTAPVSRAPSTSTSSSGPGKRRGRATAPGRLKKSASAGPAAPSAAPADPSAVPGVAPFAQDDGPGNSENAPGRDNGHGPPPWAHGRH